MTATSTSRVRRCRSIAGAGLSGGLLAAVALTSTAGAADIRSAPGEDGTTLYSVDLDTGATSEIGTVGNGLQVVGLAIAPGDELGDVWAVTDAGELVTFAADAPGAATAAPITGLDPEDPLVGIDTRPADGTLVGLTGNGVVFTVDTANATASRVGDGINPLNEAAALGFDFNPTVDRIRVDVITGQNLRLNPDTGAVGTNPETGALTVDGQLAYATADANEGTAPAAVGAGYTNPVADATETQLFVIDSATSSLVLQDPPNDGVLNTVGELGIDVTEATSFDIAASGDALLAVPSAAFG